MRKLLLLISFAAFSLSMLSENIFATNESLESLRPELNTVIIDAIKMQSDIQHGAKKYPSIIYTGRDINHSPVSASDNSFISQDQALFG